MDLSVRIGRARGIVTSSMRSFVVRTFPPALALGVGLGCAEDPPAEDPTPVPLAAADAWVRVTDPAADAFASMRPEGTTCDEAGVFLDPFTLSLEINTDLCDYATVEQPITRALAPGDVVNIQAFHYELTAPDPAEGYLGLAIDGVIVWEGSAPIPSAPGPISGEVALERAFPAGAALQWHVHNHGPNTWELLSLMVTPSG